MQGIGSFDDLDDGATSKSQQKLGDLCWMMVLYCQSCFGNLEQKLCQSCLKACYCVVFLAMFSEVLLELWSSFVAGLSYRTSGGLLSDEMDGWTDGPGHYRRTVLDGGTIHR